MHDARPAWLLRRVVSGGQTGVDRGALDAALSAGIPHGGWCPRGRLAEDGLIPARYQLRETPSAKYAERTRRNVEDSCATLILCRGPLSGGTQLTHRYARKYAKPCLVVDLTHDADPRQVQRWIADCQATVLNVAGPRESTSPGIAHLARDFLVRVFEQDVPATD